MKKNLFLAFICSVCLIACEKDPLFNKEEMSVESTAYIDNVSFHSADVYCQIEANLSINKVVVQYGLNSNMKRADEKEMRVTSDYPDKAEFDKNVKVYYCDLTELLSDTVYYCVISAETPVGMIELKKNSLRTLSLSTTAVTTQDATDITLSSATLHGCILQAGDIFVGKRGFYYSTHADMSGRITLNTGSGVGEFQSTITNLEANITYYFSAFAFIDGEEYLGETKSFTTTNYTKAQVTTGGVSEIKYTSAICEMQIIDAGNSKIQEAGIMYGTTSNFTLETGVKVPYSTSSSYSYNTNKTYKVTLQNLESDRYYHYCGYATNSAGTTMGEIKSFQTKTTGDLSVTTGGQSSISYKSAYLYYSIKSQGYNVLEHGIIYDTNDNTWLSYDDGSCQIIKSTTNAGVTTDWTINNKSCYISSLTPGTRYVYKAYAIFKYKNWMGEDEEEIYYGDEDSFETLSYGVPSVTTNAATDIYTSTAKISLTASSNGSTITDRGFYISSDYRAMNYSDPEDFETHSNIWTKKSIGKSSSSTTLTNLEDGTTYYYVAYATNGEGTGYGNVKSFSTKELKMPKVYTSLESNSSTSAKLGGSTDGGGEKGVTVGFVYSSTTTDPTIGNATKIVVSTSFTETDSNYGWFYKTLTYSSSTFQKNTIYYFKAFCTNSLGTSYGAVMEFEF